MSYELIVKSRGEGKTFDLIKLAIKTGSTIIVGDYLQVRYIEEICKYEDLPIPKTISLKDILSGRYRGYRNTKGYLIDDLGFAVQKLLKPYGVEKINGMAINKF